MKGCKTDHKQDHLASAILSELVRLASENPNDAVLGFKLRRLLKPLLKIYNDEP